MAKKDGITFEELYEKYIAEKKRLMTRAIEYYSYCLEHKQPPVNRFGQQNWDASGFWNQSLIMTGALCVLRSFQPNFDSVQFTQRVKEETRELVEEARRLQGLWKLERAQCKANSLK